MKLIEGLQSGIHGIFLVHVFYILMSPIVIVDQKIYGIDRGEALS